ncbi:DNA excision repair protein ERCC-6-like 2 [Lates japonicus]|uniref:DNA excision repair protein ERCC-6-like 2 n=1 Tax=Lates japonicus TaxID=270547 RepID=A0AAD3NKJ8_LATJO|nr:DNA excision repair protein ERCC-6-like 2 [Lates japonicus]
MAEGDSWSGSVLEMQHLQEANYPRLTSTSNSGRYYSMGETSVSQPAATDPRLRVPSEVLSDADGDRVPTLSTEGLRDCPEGRVIGFSFAAVLYKWKAVDTCWRATAWQKADYKRIDGANKSKERVQIVKDFNSSSHINPAWFPPWAEKDKGGRKDNHTHTGWEKEGDVGKEHGVTLPISETQKHSLHLSHPSLLAFLPGGPDSIPIPNAKEEQSSNNFPVCHQKPTKLHLTFI